MRAGKTLTLCLALLLLFAATPVYAAVFHTDIRVLLSVGAQQSLSVTPVGEYYLLEDPDLTVGTEELTLTRAGSRVSLTLDGKTVTGPSLTLMSRDYGGRSAYIRLKNEEYGTCTYLGNMTFDVAGGAVRAINTLPTEQYLYGVVPHEMSNSFPVEALKAQAVCARGYAVARCSTYASRAYDILDTSKDQVYRGYASKNIRAIAAVDATKGQLLTYDGDIIEAFYSASNGGQTEKTGNVWENDLPYYTQADDQYDLDNASSLEEISFIPAVFDEGSLGCMDRLVYARLLRMAYEAAGESVTLLSTVNVIPHTPSYDPPSRCYTQADVTLMVQRADGEEGQLTVTLPLEDMRYGESAARTLGSLDGGGRRLRMRGAEPGSATTATGESYTGWYLTMRRYGHGVGLSQRGAQERARAGQSYTDMLSFYYVDTVLNTIGAYDEAPRLKSDSYTIKSWGISGVEPGTKVDKFMDALSSRGELLALTPKGKTKTEGSIGTGDYVRTVYEDGKFFFDLPVVIYGDLDGDGSIGEGDVTALRDHLTRATLLTGARLIAADVDHNDATDALDLLRLIRAVQGEAEIRQGS